MLFVPAPVSRYFIIDLLPGRSFAGHVAAAGFDVYIADFGTPSREDRFADLAYYVEGLVRRCVRTVSALTGEDAHQRRRLLPGRHAVAALCGAAPRDGPPARAC